MSSQWIAPTPHHLKSNSGESTFQVTATASPPNEQHIPKAISSGAQLDTSVHVPLRTRIAAQAAADRRFGVQGQRADGAHQQTELDELVTSMRAQGRLSNAGSHGTPISAASYVDRWPKVPVSAKLIHAADLARRAQSSGYSLTGGRRPSNRFWRQHADQLQSLRLHAHRNNRW
jgi:hypothetical protein